MRPLIILVFVFVSFNSFAQFGAQNVITTNYGLPWDVLVADLDGDGDDDFALGSRADNNGVWFSNDGGGNFVLQQIFSSTHYVRNMHFVDMNGDGVKDLLGMSSTGVYWYDNNGSGVFGPEAIVAIGAPDFIDVDHGDFDNDGDADIVVGKLSTGPQCVYYENVGSGVFAAGTIIDSSMNEGYRIQTQDFNNDGNLDFMLATSLDGSILWYPGNGSGQFGTANPISTTPCGAPAPFLADLDGDLDQDVLAICQGDGSVKWYQNLGSGMFGPPQLITTTCWSVSVFGNCLADYDQDGDVDIAISCNAGVNEIQWFANSGTGVFGSGQLVSDQVVQPRSTAAGDFNGDGFPDILSLSWDSPDKVAWYANGGGSTGIDAQGTSDQMFASPNPFSAQTLLIFDKVFSSTDLIEVYDLHGRLVKKVGGNGSRKLVLMNEEMHAGMYLVRLSRSGVQEGTLRIVVE